MTLSLRTDLTTPSGTDRWTFRRGPEAIRHALASRHVSPELLRAFENVELQGAYVMPNGAESPFPFLGKAKLTSVYGRIDLDYARELTRGTGYTPVVIKEKSPNGEEHAVLQLFVLRFQDTTLGYGYDELAGAIAVSPEGQPIVRTDENDLSPVAAMTTPGARALNVGLLLDVDAREAGRVGADQSEPVELGIETVGLNKARGHLTSSEGRYHTVRAADADGRAIFELRCKKQSKFKMLLQLPQLAKAFGVRLRDLGQLPKTAVTHVLNRDVKNDASLVASASTTTLSKGALLTTAGKHDSFVVSEDSPAVLAEISRRGHFELAAIQTDTSLLFQYQEDAPRAAAEPPDAETPRKA
ncbi:MAG: hypothetical protein IPJ65_34030 [Archangiaceae bacterium]|nr:hypothetical protein [Archangiaceae bacterium]